MIVELPADVGSELIETGLARSASSSTRSAVGEAVEVAVTISGVGGPVMLVAVADETAKAAMGEVYRLIGSLWRRARPGESLAFEVKLSKDRVTVKAEASGESPEQALEELLSAVERVLAKRRDPG
jgi:hypothetical protein